MNRAVGGLALAATLLLGACTPARRATTGDTPPPLSRSPSATATTSAAGLHRTTLTCADEAAPSSPPSATALRVSGLAFDGLGDAARASISALPAVGSDSQRYHLLKAFLYVTEQASPRTIVTLTAPATARLYYTDATTWAGHPSDQQIIANATTSVSVEPCPDRLAGYTGGGLVQEATCVVLHLQGSRERRPHAVTVPIGVQRCR